jgi:hypothetical protein
MMIGSFKQPVQLLDLPNFLPREQVVGNKLLGTRRDDFSAMCNLWIAAPPQAVPYPIELEFWNSNNHDPD